MFSDVLINYWKVGSQVNLIYVASIDSFDFLRIPVNDSFFYPMAPFWVSNLDKQNQLVFESQRC